MFSPEQFYLQTKRQKEQRNEFEGSVNSESASPPTTKETASFNFYNRSYIFVLEMAAKFCVKER